MISSELQSFYTRWLQKAEGYQNQNLQDCFDRFFTLYVAFNRLYFELAIYYVKKGLKGKTINSYEKRPVRQTPKYISDAQAAKHYVQIYLGSEIILRSLQSDACCTESLMSIIDLLERKVFAIKLDRFSGERKVEADSTLVEGLKSNNAYKKIYAILDMIYSIRCNMFHGQKGYEDVQIKILVPVTILLKKIMRSLYEKMSRDYYL